MNIKELKTKVKITLPSVLDAHKAEELYTAMMESTALKKNIEITADEIERIDTLCVQILLATQQNCLDQNIDFHIKNPSKKMAKTLNVLGLEQHLLKAS